MQGRAHRTGGPAQLTVEQRAPPPTVCRGRRSPVFEFLQVSEIAHCLGCAFHASHSEVGKRSGLLVLRRNVFIDVGPRLHERDRPLPGALDDGLRDALG